MGWIKQETHYSGVNSSKGFALPTVLVVSVVMMIVLLAALTSVSSISAGMRNQYIDQVGRSAAKSGLAMASACLKSSGGAITWTDAAPLKPNTDCTGVETTSCPSTSTNNACYVMKSNNFRTTFRLGVISDSNGNPKGLNAQGIVREVRKTSGEVVRQSQNSIKAVLNTGVGQQVYSASDEISGSVISERSGNDSVSTSTTSRGGVAQFVSYVCGTRVSDNTVTCSYSSSSSPSSSSYPSSPFSSTAMKNISVSTTTTSSVSAFVSYTCGIRASDSTVTCSYGSNSSPSSSSYPTSPLSSTAVTDISTSTTTSSTIAQFVSYTCGIRVSDSVANCSYGTSSSPSSSSYPTSPLSSTAMKDVSTSTTDSSSVSTYVSYTCGIRASDSAVICGYGSSSSPGAAAYPSSPMSSTTMKDVSTSTTTSSSASQFVSYTCGIRASDSTVTCNSASNSSPNSSAYPSSPMSSTTMKDISTSTTNSSSITQFVSYTCGIRASDSTVTCNSASNSSPNSSAYPSSPLSSTAMPDFGSDNPYTYCGVDITLQASCNTSTTSSPFSTTAMRSVSIVKNNDSTVCGIYTSNNQVSCTSFSAAPFGTSSMKDVTVSTNSGIAVCAIYKSNSQVACTTDNSLTPFVSTQLSSIAVSVGTSGGYNARICAVKRSDSYATCSTAVTNAPFNTTQVSDISVGTSGTSNGQYVCGISAATSLANCASSISASPFAGTKMLDVAVTTDSAPYVCGIMASNKEISCVSIAASPYGTNALNASQPNPANSTTGSSGSEYFISRDYSCTVAEGSVYCWGLNNTSQVGDGTTTQRNTPVLVGGALAGKTVTQMVTTSNGESQQGSVCAIASSQLYCWGENGYGQLGDGTTTDRTTPTLVSALAGKTVTQVVMAGAETNSGGYNDSYTCAIADNQLYCWGSNSSGQLGYGAVQTTSYTPTLVGGALAGKTVTKVAAHVFNTGGYWPNGNTCAIASGQLYCWGYGYYGQVGDGTGTTQTVPVLVGGAMAGKTVSQISISRAYSCAVAESNLYCWGFNSTGQVGDGTTTQRNSPVLVSGALVGKQITQLVTSSSGASMDGTVCVIASEQLYCWGSNRYSQLGDGTGTDRSTPTLVGAFAGKKVAQVVTVGAETSSGGYNDAYSCAIADYELYCWGSNSYGQLGYGTLQTVYNSPGIVAGALVGKAVTSVSAHVFNTGGYWPPANTCAIAEDQMYCWGYGYYGQVGDGTATNQGAPVLVGGALAGKKVGFSKTSSLFSGSFFYY